ncbi:hypothetical protein SAMN02910317_02275 [Ruminococcaceae bacterium FB2012]|nr:hypothetical protein SAMN02910317_02275 [Ruminococcaceae bacterium FB2012]
MLNHKIGITATELFACNPFRVLGIAVNSSKADIDKRYNDFVAAANAGHPESLRTPFDFESLPPFSRDAAALKTAYAKLASNGYRCFAYSDSAFTVPLNIDDVALNLRDITCYDCFLRCYMWLVINDPDMEEHELWIMLAKYIDKLITSSPDKFERLFDNRFPAEMVDPQKSVYRAFYVTFCEIILLPLKEMVRGSMKCDNASDILKLKGIDINEYFEPIDIPQGNLPAPGQPAPKLKLALREGEEYYDPSTGQMKSFSGETTEIESNEFAQAASTISADAIFEEPDESRVIPDEPTVAPRDTDDDDIAGRKPLHFQSTSEPGTETSAPKMLRRPSSSQVMTPSETDNEPEAPAARPQRPAPTQNASSQPYTAPTTVESPTADSNQPKVVAPTIKKKKQATRLIDEESQGLIKDSTDINLTEMDEEEEEEQNIYTQALVQMLRANRSRNQFMKDVDTKHAFNNGDAMAAPQTPNLKMDEINMKVYDRRQLDSPYEMAERAAQGKTLEEKYGNIKIDDMLNPTLGAKSQRVQYEPDAIDQYKKHQAEQKKSMKNLIILGSVAILGVGIVVLLLYMGIL